MKFGERYGEFMRGRDKRFPVVDFKNLKTILNSCGTEFQPQHHQTTAKQNEDNSKNSSLPLDCPEGLCGFKSAVPVDDLLGVCDVIFFPSLLKKISEVIACFNEKARSLLELHSASCLWKWVLQFGTNKLSNDHGVLMQQVKNLISYAIINSAVIRKILHKYNKLNCAKQGEMFKAKTHCMHLEILQSPWLCELLAFYIYLRRKASGQAMTAPWLFDDCSLSIDDGKPMLSYSLFDSANLEIELSCSICLETVFDAVDLRCGHIFCYMCSCSAASVTIIDGMDAIDRKAKCPLCRQAGVHKGAVGLSKLNLLLSESCPDCWKQRLQTERIERVRQAKVYWDSQCQSLLGI